VADTLSDTRYPVIFFFHRSGGHSVDCVLAFHHFALRVGFAGFDEVVAASRVQFETVGFVAVLNFTNLNVFQGNDSSRFFVGRVLEVIEAVVVENEPAPLPRFVSAT